MAEFLAGLWNTPGLGWIVLATFTGGLVRGFTGFGTALVFLPVAALFLSPFQAILALTAMDILGPLPVLRRAWGAVAKADLARLGTATALCLPLGLLALAHISPVGYSLIVSLLALGMLTVLALGLRWRGAVSRAMVTAIGAVAGLLGGLAGLPGPAVILFYMSRPLPIATIRATILFYLFVYDILILGWMGAFGRWDGTALGLGFVLAGPAMAGNWLGGRMFDPAYERIYRWTAYVLIAISALSGLMPVIAHLRAP